MYIFNALLFSSFYAFVYSVSCGYENCPKTSDSFINLHFVPHTHNDVGWLKTPDQYYYGVRNSIQDAGVQYILDSVVHELLQDSNKRFIYVETAFFWQWWQEQSDSMRHNVKRLVNNGQLEFIGGGWSMNDEATTHYQSIIDQFTWGFRRLNDTFGKCGRPKIGWQIDPFGHSRENAAIMAKMGFDGLFLGRIDFQDKIWRVDNQTMEMIWQTSQNDLSEESQLFTSVLYNTYSAPKGFCFDINCDDEPIVDNVKSPEYNANRRVAQFLNAMRRYSEAYKTNNILVTMGEDFMYMDAHVYFKNMDKLIKLINKLEGPNSPFKAFYSTPSCYVKSVNEAQDVKLPEKSDDFFPYSSDPDAFWTGYFTSRPTIKRFERIGNNFLQVCKQLYSLSDLGYDLRNSLISLREAMGVMQHHDAITGTEKQQVASEYARILTNGIQNCHKVTQKALGKIVGEEADIEFHSCLQLNVSSCDISEKEDNFVITIYNPLSRPVDRLIRLPIKEFNMNYSVKCPMGKEQMTQIMPVAESVISIPGRRGNALAELGFLAKNLPPLGFKSYYVSKITDQISFKSKRLHPKKRQVVGFENGIKLTFTPNGRLKSMSDKRNKDFPITQTFAYYTGAVGNNKGYKNRSSGAYIFRPNSTQIPIDDTDPDVHILEGPIYAEVHFVYSNWVSQIIRTYRGSNYAELQWIVGPIPIDDNTGKEIVSVYHTSAIHNNGEFFTDSNGREALKRVMNQRETWPLHLVEPIAGNYYPVTTRISIEELDTLFSVITDRAEGGSSLKDGQIELMLHRRLLHDDAFGVKEALNETAFGEGLVAIGSHYLTRENHGKARMLVQEKILDSWIFLTPTNLRFEDWQNAYKMEYSGLLSALPDNVQILTLEPWSHGSFLLRLEHIMEKSDDPVLSKSATINLKNLFKNFQITGVEEMMLGANLKTEESKRLVWNSKGLKQKGKVADLFKITLKPMQIRTFIIEMEPNSKLNK